jgi:hypothetical protein
MWLLGLVVAVGGYSLFYELNSWWASRDSGALMQIMPTRVIWCFAPGFGALLVPWLATLWLLRRFGYAGQAEEIVIKGNQKMGANGERIMKGLGWGVVLPIALFTVPAIPIHMSVMNDEVRVTHYGHLAPVVYEFKDAKQAYWIDGYNLRDGSFQAQPDLLIDFADGRRLDASAVGDGGSVPSQQLVDLLLTKSQLTPVEVKTSDDIPKQ